MPDLKWRYCPEEIEMMQQINGGIMGKATEGIAADLTKYPDDTLKLFIVYDPEGKIYDRNTFKRDFEDKRYCIIHII